ncbi:hypothetical protein [Terasakiella pusilla]|uniref:hypothetical protein n=1 Tax=Terasakiella pusilla TaxID=64973 RepID=UPI003AA85F9E
MVQILQVYLAKRSCLVSVPELIAALVGGTDRRVMPRNLFRLEHPGTLQGHWGDDQIGTVEFDFEVVANVPIASGASATKIVVVVATPRAGTASPSDTLHPPVEITQDNHCVLVEKFIGPLLISGGKKGSQTYRVASIGDPGGACLMEVVRDNVFQLIGGVVVYLRQCRR